MAGTAANLPLFTGVVRLERMVVRLVRNVVRLVRLVRNVVRLVRLVLRVHQFHYLKDLTTNITTLEKEAKKLQDTAADLQWRVNRARDAEPGSDDEVNNWLRDYNNIKNKVDEILKKVPNVETGCVKFIARYSLSKRAEKATILVKQIQDRSDFHAHGLDFRIQFEKDIMKTLKLGDVNMVGIYGIGGLGKTNMARRVMNRALEEHVFEEVVMVVVSQPIDESRLQLEIGKSLRLKLQGESSQTRAQKLRTRLSGPKRTLLVLDDVRGRLVLRDLGIPSNHKGCTILLTSRSRDVLSEMNVQKIFQMQVLSDKDAWLLFRDRAGTCVDDTKLNPTAKEVAKECKGLPIALTIVGAALRGEKNMEKWKDALGQLKQSDPDIPELLPNVYAPLKLCYDALDPKQRSVFWLCCLYPKDDDIPLERLTYSCMGIDIFGSIESVEEARNMIPALTNVLKERSLLLDGWRGNKYVRMHNVIHDICIIIAKHKGCIGGDGRSWISLTPSSQLPTELEVPNLSILMWTHNSENEKFELDGSFIQGVGGFHVLSIENNNFLTSLQLTTQSLKHLKTLVLYWCGKLETLSGVEELVNLENLICCGCNLVKELPSEMKVLNQLKVLDLTKCENLERIGRGIISSLVGLEELKMLGSFKNWEAENREEKKNSALRELEALTNLSCLEIEIENPLLAVEKMHLSSKLDRFDIRFSSYNYQLHRFDRKMRMSLEVGHWIDVQILRDTESLVLEENDVNKVGLTKLESTSFLDLNNCESMKKIMISWMNDCGGTTVLSHNFFENLKELRLHHLPALKQVWEGSSQEMDYLLPQLEVLSILRCEMMERVFLWEGVDENEENSIQSPDSHHITTKILPKLKKLKLIDLSNMTSFCQGIQGIEFPQLRKFRIAGCNKMKIMVSNGKESNVNNSGGSNNSNAEIHDLHYRPEEISFGCLEKLSTDWHPFDDHKIDVSQFKGLEELTIADYKSNKSLITPSIAKHLVKLKVLRIQWCDGIVKVIEDDEEKLISGGQMTPLFPELVELWLVKLSKLESFCEWECDVELPLLRKLNIRWCDKMKNFTKGVVYTPKLESVKIISDDGVGKDLNEMLQQFDSIRAKEKQQEEKKKGGERWRKRWNNISECSCAVLQSCNRKH